MVYLGIVVALVAVPANAGQRADERAIVNDLVEAIESDQAVADLGHDSVINSAQAEFLDSMQECEVIDHYDRNERSAHLWIECAEPISAGEVTSQRWSIDLAFEEGVLVRFGVYDLTVKPIGWEPSNG